jgi:hypothetical protein
MSLPISSACGSDTPEAVRPATSLRSGNDAPSSSTLPALTTTVVKSTSTSSSQPTSTVPTNKSAAFEKRLRAYESSVSDLIDKLGQAPVPAEGVEQLRVAMCAPTFVAPNKDKIGVSVALFIRGKAQSDPATGAKWLADGILTEYEKHDLAGGTFTVNVVWNDAVMNRLVDSGVDFYGAIAAGHETYC